MRNMPLATVIIPSYNSPDLYATLNSVQEQDYPRIQLIIVDDASDAFSPNEVISYLHQSNSGNLESIHVLVNPKNQGTVYTMNRALQYSNGDFIFNLASDDCFYDNQVLSDWVAAFLKTGAGVMTGYRAIYDNQLDRCLGVQPFPEQVRKIQEKAPAELFEEIAGTNFIFGCCTARRADIIHKYGLYDARYCLIEDHPMNLKLLRMGEPIVFFDRIVVKYRNGGTSSPTRYNETYKRDVDQILLNEVLPYTKYPLQARWNHLAWKREQHLLQQRQQLWERCQGSRPLEILVLILFYLRRPWRTLHGAIARIHYWKNKGE